MPSRPGRVVAAAVAAQATAGVGFYAVLAHLALHLRNDLALAAAAAGAVLTARVLGQYLGYLPAGRLTDRLGGARAAGLACLVRGTGFALLGLAADGWRLIAAAVLIGVGGAGYTPAGQALLAGLPGDWPRRGYAWYTAVGQGAAVAGPVAGLTVLAGADGFAGICALAALLSWLGGLLLLAVRTEPCRTRRPALRTIVRDQALLRLAVAAWPVTLLITQSTILVPQILANDRLITVFLTTGAAMTAAAQLPCWRPLWVGPGLVAGFTGFAVAYLLIGAALWFGPGLGLVLISGTVYGAAQGVLLPALFVRLVRLAPGGTVGSYAGVLHFLTGAVAFVVGVALGPGAVLVLAGCAAAAALVCARTSPG